MPQPTGDPAERAAMDTLEAWGLVHVRARPGKGERAYTYFDLPRRHAA